MNTSIAFLFVFYIEKLKELESWKTKTMNVQNIDD